MEKRNSNAKVMSFYSLFAYLGHYRKAVIKYHCKDFLFNLTLYEYGDSLGTQETYLLYYCFCKLSFLLDFYGNSIKRTKFNLLAFTVLDLHFCLASSVSSFTFSICFPSTLKYEHSVRVRFIC